ncbi:myosin heavy chain, muscle [Lepeophtheirus salmonis]|uniref:myosin heavy chain, muscle n=1 Tax=Lepeophtheirus salmonis TaxID=72036 RepID=UPI001AE8065C|nr:myosin heavy chain, muscle-like [Lepeophtheirus salmonis]
MPGHIKKSEGPDPDPDQWLIVSDELKVKLKSKPYDAKKSCWVPDKSTGGYDEGLIQSTDGDKVTVKILGSDDTKVFKKDQVGQVNPPKFDCSDDMSGLTYLNDACVLWNSVVRYKNELIYTYSGLFCIAINPYKRFPIYTQRAMDIYIGKRRSECPPHIFGVAEGSYQGMLNAGKNQSILITGESGAGKTENTKKVISYFASIGASGKKKEGEVGLEDKIVQTNPVLEAWGNAKTVRNDNSSRFGKFIRIWFNQGGKLSGADMVVYLLEKSRLTFQAELERCYHAFYNIMSDAVPELKENCLLSNDIYDYWWVSQGKVTVPSIDDKEDMQFADEAYDILGFSQEEKFDVYKLTSVVMHMGNMTKDFVPVGKEEQAEIKDDTNSIKVATLCGIDSEWMNTYFCKPKLKVGMEWVSKGQTCSGAASSVAGIGRKIYELTFRFIVEKCNETLFDPTMKKVQYIGCLDIAGFEIFDYNGFEQICINFCNEKLQQFFNQHMFVLEQEEYVREGIEWANVDFGMDLQKCITMFEKPMGLLSILEEESLFPKATDQTFAAKLHENLLGKCENFQKPNPRPDPNAHFAVIHYAATVSYNLTAWLEKNKDPLNDTIVELFKNGSNKLLVECFRDHPGQPIEAKKDSGGRKKGGGKTVSSFYKTQLDDLMKTLYATDPAFIRCVVPNTHKQPGGVEPGLVMHQYQCNGVLAGIAICRKGFPNKMVYPEFKNRYNILAAQAVAKAKNDKNAAAAVLKSIKLDAEKFRLGHTKVFFRAGILGYMEEIREDKIGAVLSWLQAQARGKTSRLVFKKMQDQKLALYCCQRTIRNWHIGKTWLWWQVWLFLKPNLKCTKFSQYKAEYEEKIAIAEANIDKALAERKKVEVVNSSLLNQKNELVLALQSGGSAVQDIIDKTVRIEAMAADVQKQLDDCNNRIKGEKTQKESIEQAQSKVNIEMNSLGDEIKNLEDKLGNAEQDRSDKDDQIRTLREEIEHQNDMIQKLHREKKNVGDSKQKTEEDIQAMEDRCNHLSKVKGKLEQALDEAEDSLEREKKCKGDIEKLKRKVEGDLKLTQETVSDLERVQAELNQSVQRKDKELSALSAKIEDESTLGSKYGKQIKELQSRMEELDEELIIERQNRSKAEKNRSILKKDIEDLGSRLEEAGASTATQVELNKKREAELGRLKSELEEMTIAQEGTLAALRMKHNNTMAELGEQIDGLNNNKMKSEKDKANMERDLQEARSNLEEGVRGKAEIDKNGKLIQGSIVDANQKLDELARALNEGDSQKKRLQVEKADLERQIDEGENAMATLNKQKISLTTQFEDNKRIADGEARDCSSLLTKFKNLTTDLENIKERIEDEHQRKSDCLKALSKAQAETQLWRSRYETEGMGRVEELEGSRGKLQARIQEAEETVESLQSKISNGEKSKNRMQADLDDISMEYERTHAAAIITEKRGKNFDKVINEWKCKGDDISNELDASEKECRNYNSELFRLRAAQNDVVEQLDIVKRENKNLADEIKDLLDQLGDGGRSIHELDKQRRRLEVEKEEFQAALEEAEAALEQEENKVLRAQLELGQAKQEIDHKIQEKEDIFNNTRKNHQRAMDSLSASLEAEQKAKSEALRIKKKLESDINELEIALDHANKANSEGQKAIKRYQSNLRDTIQAYEDQCHHRQEIMENVGICDRKANALSGELEESRALLNSSERSKRQLDTELVDSRNTTNEMQVINSKAMHEKRNVESIIHTLQAEIDEVLSQAKNSEEKSKRAMIDAARLADELRAEQEHTTNGDRCNRALGSQLSELENRLIDAENASMKSGKEILSKLEMKIRELEIELGSVQSRTQENYKAYQRSERKIKELQFQQEEDRNNQDKMSDLASKLQQKIKTYKQQIEEAEEIAALNLAKYRKAQQELEETEERCKMANTSMSTV